MGVILWLSLLKEVSYVLAACIIVWVVGIYYVMFKRSNLFAQFK